MHRTSQPFHRISRRYRLINQIISFGLDSVWRRSTISEAEIKSGMIVLDLGSGPGDLLELVKSDVRKIGLDPEKKMLMETRSNFFGIQGVGEKLPVRSESIDRVVSAFVLRNLSDRRASFQEIHRVLAKGGLGAVIDFSPPVKGALWHPVNLFLRYVLPLAGGILANDFDAYKYLSRTILAFPAPYQVEKELIETGFCNVRFRRLIGGVAVLYGFRKLDY